MVVPRFARLDPRIGPGPCPGAEPDPRINPRPALELDPLICPRLELELDPWIGLGAGQEPGRMGGAGRG